MLCSVRHIYDFACINFDNLVFVLVCNCKYTVLRPHLSVLSVYVYVHDYFYANKLQYNVQMFIAATSIVTQIDKGKDT